MREGIGGSEGGGNVSTYVKTPPISKMPFILDTGNIAVEGAGKTVEAAAEGTKETVTTAARGVGDSVEALAKLKPVTAIKEVLTGAGDTVGDAIDTVGETANSAVNAVGDTAKEIVTLSPKGKKRGATRVTRSVRF